MVSTIYTRLDIMAKSERQDPDKEHSQSLNRKPEPSRHRKKQRNKEITQYFSKVQRQPSSNPNLPISDKALIEQLSQQALELQEKERLLLQRKEEASLRLQNQKDDHDRKMSRLRATAVQELKLSAQIQRCLSKQRQAHILTLQANLRACQQVLKAKRQTLERIQPTSFQYYFLGKQIKNEQNEQQRLNFELAVQMQKDRLSQEEELCYLAKEGWPTLNKRYQSLRLIGKGGFSEVYEAYDLDRHQTVAVKLSEVDHLLMGRGNKMDYLKHIKRQYEVHKRLSHPNIVPLIEVLEVDNAICIVLEHCSGPTLAQLLRRQTSLPEQQAKMIVKQLLSVVSYLSTQRIVHYDLKPQNIIFQNGLTKVLDFGICKIIDNEHSKMALTSQGVGTYCYLPPETFASSNPVLSNKVDVWSLGVIFYEMVYGYRPVTHQLNQKGEPTFPLEAGVSAQAISFMRGCLKSALPQRLDPFSAQKHPYFNSPDLL